MKKIFFVFIVFSLLLSGYAQYEGSNFSLGIGGTHTSFQNTKHNLARFNGYGVNSNIGFDHYWDYCFVKTFFNYSFSLENPNVPMGYYFSNKTHNLDLYANFNFYLTDNISIGPYLRLFDYSNRINQGLGPSSYYSTTGHNFGVNTTYIGELLGTLSFNTSLSIHLLSIRYESMGFSNIEPQVVVENAEVSYQGGDASGLNLNNYTFEHIASFIDINYYLGVDVLDWLEVYYNWRITHYSTVPDYPTTTGIHNIGCKFNIITAR